MKSNRESIVITRQQGEGQGANKSISVLDICRYVNNLF